MAKIVKTEGSIYFLRDVDYLTGEAGRYVKIGLVRNDKSTEKRIKEHQTGNPRGIVDVFTLSDVPFVEKLETQLHYRFIHKWIVGEWLDLNEEETNEVIKEADRLKGELISYRDEFYRADELENVISNGNVLPADENAGELRDQYLKFHEQKEITGGQLKIVRSQLLEKLGKNGSIEGVLSITEASGGTGFNMKEFEEKYPEYIEEYQVMKEGKAGGTFSVEGKLRFAKIAPELDAEIKDLPKENLEQNDLNSVLSLDDEIKKLHLKHLDLLKQQRINDWDIDIIICRLKCLTGENDGIEGVCKWQRTQKEGKSVFDEARFKLEYPEIYEKFRFEKPAVRKVNINSTRPYPV